MSYNYEQLLPQVIEISRQAAEQILEIYNSPDAVDVEHKEDNTPLTAADMAAHNTIVAGLAELTTDLPILSEESSTIPFAERSQWQRYWLVDPLDGTREFIKRNGEFTVNIALIENQLPVMGVIYVPVTGDCYYACKGQGAFKRDKAGNTEQLKVRRRPANYTIVAGSRSHAHGSLNRFLDNIGEHEIISMGSSLKSCLVAAGKADIYPRIGPTSEWDTAAAQAIVEEAGGQVTTTDMERMRYNTKESLLNPYFLVFGDGSVDWKSYLEE